MQTISVELTAGELTDIIDAVYGIVHMTQWPELAEKAGVDPAQQQETCRRYQLLLAKLSDYIQHPDIVQ